MKQKYLMSWDDDDNDDDNMRGWNPASEDDTHDNGMGRWSENNDEKGWWWSLIINPPEEWKDTESTPTSSAYDIKALFEKLGYRL